MPLKRMPVLAVTSFLGLLVLCAAAAGAPLPNRLGPWTASSRDTVPFRTASEDLGTWHNRVYERHAPAARIEAVLMEGAGPGTLRVPPKKVDAVDLPIGFGSRYRTLEIAGHRAILEAQDLLGLALAIELGKDRTLTLESAGTTREELIEFAEKMVGALTKR